MRPGLTKRQADVLTAIRDYTREHDGLAPTLRELCDRLVVRAQSTIYKHLCHLESKLYISRHVHESRSMVVLEDETPSQVTTIAAFVAGWDAAQTAAINEGQSNIHDAYAKFMESHK